MSKDSTAKTAAGLRGANWDPNDVPSDTKFLPVALVAGDGASCQGILAHRGGERTAVLGMHPREFAATHYMVPELLKGGAAVLMQAPRLIGNDIRLEHERALFDVAAGVQYLRDQGYEHVILLGNSGGAGLFSFYAQQSNLPPAERLTKTPAGKPIALGDADLPPCDGIIFVSPHPGQGALLMNSIDPSVTDESDALSMDPELFPFNPFNGFKRPPQSSSYTEEFITRYRAAQKKRVERIDAWALDAVGKRIDAKKRLKEARNPNDIVLSNHTPIITVWRTDADLRCFDLSLDPSSRRYGSLWGPNPFVSNFGSVGFARSCTADSWLSTWSGLHSNASMAKTTPGITQPTLMVVYDGDNSVFPADAQEIFETIGAEDKNMVTLPGDHHGRAVGPDGESGRAQAGATIRAWIGERFA